MAESKKIAVIIPVLNEEKSIGLVLDALPREKIETIVLVDGGSQDDTVKIAGKKGATVLNGPTLGYGHACLMGLEHLSTFPPNIVVFLDGDYSDFPEEISLLIDPILKGEKDFVLGSRIAGRKEEGAMPFHAVWGNKIACFLINLLFGHSYSDLGPFRAIRYDKLMELHMRDLTYGWTVEMQVKAVRVGLKIVEIPVSYRKRLGKSKISGSFSGSVKAGTKIIFTILKNFL